MTDPLPGLSLHHVGILVRDFLAAVGQYRSLGFDDPDIIEVPEQQIIAAVFKVGHGYVELIAPTDTESGTARYLAKRGEGTHHIAYAVPDIASKLQELRAAGFRLIDDVPRTGAHNWRIGFIHPESCHGVLTELVQEQ
ncbi:MAG: methylmalonyl-CoA epimerase [Thermomicrobiales bacterium]